ncbi:hypothetical protein DB88DRAFT_525452 [Papiliotrema laurentii]|uniref:Uncharacterized protein n=1 Tax=Papiliotrema laurentii TaxID=5418 RepID=A0AAD9L6A0_PAPLA|nr:hypothetical protein DB88DRAFT_525452 [Papiliotrema laurentii]
MGFCSVPSRWKKKASSMMSDFTMRGSSSPSSQPVSNNDNYQSEDINIDRPPRKFPRGLFNSNRSADTGPPYSTPSSPSSREPKSEQSGVPPAATKRQVFRLGRRVQKSNRSSVGSSKLIACPTLPEVDLGGPLFETTDWESVARGIGRENSNNTHHDPSSSRRDPVASKEDSTHQDMGSPTEVTPIPFANKPPTSAHGMRGARPTQSLSTGPGRLLSPHSESGHLRAPGKTETSMRTVTTLPGSIPRIGDQSALHVRPRGYSRHESSHNHCTRSEDEEHVTFPDGSRLPLSGRRSPCGQPVPTDKSAVKLSLRDRLIEIGRFQETAMAKFFIHSHGDLRPLRLRVQATPVAHVQNKSRVLSNLSARPGPRRLAAKPDYNFKMIQPPGEARLPAALGAQRSLPSRPRP